MLIIGLLSLIIISSNNIFNLKELKKIIYVNILIILYVIIILNNTYSLNLINNGLMIFNNNLLITNYNYIIKNLILILIIIYSIILLNYSEFYKNSIYIKEFIILILFNIISIILFIESINSLILFISIELQSYIIYLITPTYYKNESSLNIGIYSSKNSLIYFLIGSSPSILILFGLSLIYEESGLINFIELNQYLLINNKFNYNYLLGFIFIFIGLFYKIGLPLLHNWLINIYNNILTITTLYISIILKISILTFILTLTIIFNNIFYIYNLNILFQIFIIISMIIGSLGGLLQISIKRILIYSGLVNSGYLLLPIWSNNQFSIFSYLFYIIQYSITHFILFMIIIFIIMYYNNWLIFKRQSINFNNYNNLSILNIYLNDIIDLLSYNKSLPLIFIIPLTSLIGLLLLIGFYGKYYILISSLISGYWLPSIILIISSIITSYYYGYIISTLFKSNNNNNNNNNNIYKIYNNKINYSYCYILSTLTILVLNLLIFLDIYQNGIIIINYFNNI